MASEIPAKCFAAVTVNEGADFTVEIQQETTDGGLTTTCAGPGELLIKLNCTGLCGSDIHYMTGDLGWSPAAFGVRSAGHEGAGVVVKLGPNVNESQWKVGDRAGIKPIWDVCHNCEQCWSGSEQYCSQARHTGFTNPGSYQQYVVSPAVYTPKIPDGVPDEVAGPIMCSAATMHRALVDSGLRPRQWVAFPGGGGGVGLQGVQLAKAMGMRPLVIDSGKQKREMCLKYGAEAFIDFKEAKDVAAEVKQVTDGIGAHGVLVTAWQSYKDAISLLGDRVGGKVMCIGLPPADRNVIIGDSPTHLALKRMSIQGTIVGTLQDIDAALDYARRGLLHPIHEVRGRGAWSESVQQLKEGKVAGRIVIDFNSE